jgi:hypothetical protein
MLSSVTRGLLSRNANQILRRIATAASQHIVIALGGNALLKRGEAMTMENQRQNIQEGIKSLRPILENNKVTIVHGNGPQVRTITCVHSCFRKFQGIMSCCFLTFFLNFNFNDIYVRYAEWFVGVGELGV